MAYDSDVANQLRAGLAGEPNVIEKVMFGGLGFMINGNLAVSASGQGGMLVRIDPDQAEALLALPNASPFEMRGRAMAGWLHIDAAALQNDSEFQGWVERGVDYARSLPPKSRPVKASAPPPHAR